MNRNLALTLIALGCLCLGGVVSFVKPASANTVTNPDGHVACACNATKCCCATAMGYTANMTCQ